MILMEKINKETIDKWKQNIKAAHKVATGYEPDKNLRSESDLDHIIYETERMIRLKTERHESTELILQEAGAFLMHEIATRHPFFDGNKRTALMSFLILRYVELDAESVVEKVKGYFPKSWDNKDDKIVNFMLELAQRKYTYDEVLRFIKETFK